MTYEICVSLRHYWKKSCSAVEEAREMNKTDVLGDKTARRSFRKRFSGDTFLQSAQDTHYSRLTIFFSKL